MKIFIKSLFWAITVLIIALLVEQFKPRACTLVDTYSGHSLGRYTQTRVGDSLLIEVKGLLKINRFLTSKGKVYTSNGAVEFWLYDPKTHIITVRDKFTGDITTWEVVCR